MKKDRRQRGIALMLVLSALVVLTTMAAEFAYNTNVGYHMALNERDRLQAQYLAVSSYRFMLVELKFDKMFQSIIEKQNLGQFLGASANVPLCQQFPISTQLLKALFLGGMEGEGGEGEGLEGAGGMVPEEFSKFISIEQREAASSFLDFEGDFDGECLDEGTKINLNAFAAWKPDKVVEGKLNEYDQYKEFLTKYLRDPVYEELFERAEVKPADVVRNIADWVDRNERINDMGGVMGAPEDTLYTRRERMYPIKNSKFTTPGEVYLVDGVVDEWYFPLEDRFTIYGDEKVDVCNARDDVNLALIKRYVESTPDAPVIDFEDPEIRERLITAVYDGCALGGIGAQLKKNVSTAVNTVLQEITGVSFAAAGAGAAAAGDTDTGFAQFIATERRFITLKLTGMVGETAVTIKTPLNVEDRDPKKWKVLYWRIY